MGRYRAPSTSYSDSSANVTRSRQPPTASTSTAPAPGPKPKHHGRGKKPKHGDSVRIKDHLKFAAKKQNIQAWVYVGNLHPGVTEDEITKVFHRCGPIKCITIRASRGAAVRKHERPVDRSPRDRCYATLEFGSHGAVMKALKLQKDIRRLRVKVCLSAGDLDEVRDITRRRRTLRPQRLSGE